ncbi:MAG: iron ABC transporter permease [Spirochaetaceae bacterium]|nr:iron ABC transporter permease [Spirochaetaceae bacterium]
MFTKKKIIAFCCACLVFLAVDIWMFSTVKNSFAKTIAGVAVTLAKTIASSAPGADESVPAWLDHLNTAYPGYSFFYCKGLPGEEGFREMGGDSSLAAYWAQHQSDEVFVKGVESASYLEVYTAPETMKIGAITGSLLFVPIPAETQDSAAGFLLMAADSSASRSFFSLVNALAIIAFVLFALAFGIATFSRDPVTGYVVLALFAIMLTFVAYPLFEAVRLTFITNGRFTFDTWKTILGNNQYLLALWGSIKLGLCTATLSTIIGFVFAFAVSRTSMKGKKFISALATMPVISPPFSLTLSIILLFGNNGLITKQILGITKSNIYGLGGLTLVQTVSMFPIAFMTLQGVLEAIDSTLEDASLDLNASRWQTFRSVTLPLALPGVMSAWLLVFTSSLADFANPLLLAGSYRVLSVEAYIEVTGMNRLNNGSALSLLLLVPTLTAFFVQRYLTNKKSYVVVTGKPSMRLSNLASKGMQRFLSVFIGIVIAFIILLYGTIFAGCFVKNWGIDYTFTLANIPEALTRGKDAMLSTLTLAGIATPIAGILAMVAAVLIVRKKFPGKRLLEALIMTPYAIPGTLMGISYILAFNKPPILLVGTGAILVINYVIRELPVGVEGGVAALRQIDPSIEEAAADLGADQPTIFKGIILPLIRPAFISSMSYTFVRSMTAVSAIIFLISARWYHITIQIYNFSENIRFGLASVLSTALIIIVLLVFGLMRLLVRQSEHLEKTVSIR